MRPRWIAPPAGPSRIPSESNVALTSKATVVRLLQQPHTTAFQKRRLVRGPNNAGTGGSEYQMQKGGRSRFGRFERSVAKRPSKCQHSVNDAVLNVFQVKSELAAHLK